MYKTSESVFSTSLGNNFDDLGNNDIHNKLTLNTNIQNMKSPHKKQTLLSPLAYNNNNNNNKFTFPTSTSSDNNNNNIDPSSIQTKNQSLQSPVIKQIPQQQQQQQQLNPHADSLSVGTVTSYKTSNSSTATPKSRNTTIKNDKKVTPTTPMFMNTFDKDLFDETDEDITDNVEVKKSGCGCCIF